MAAVPRGPATVPASSALLTVPAGDEPGGGEKTHPPSPQQIFIGQLLGPEEDNFYAQVEGRISEVKATETGTQLQLRIGRGWMNVEIAQPLTLAPGPLSNLQVRATGRCRTAFAPDGMRVPDVMRVSGWGDIVVLSSSSEVQAPTLRRSALPLLTTVEAVRRLPRSEAGRDYPAQIRGVVTELATRYLGMVVQDATGGVFVGTTNFAQIGDFVEVEGSTSPGDFAPIVNASRIVRLGPGRMPEPITPAWDQILNGSLASQYVEIRGVVTDMSVGVASLLTPNGSLRVILFRNGQTGYDLATNLNAMVSIRGVLQNLWNAETHQVKVGEIRICDPTVKVEQPALGDVFAAPHRTPPELLLFDPQAGLFQRVCVTGLVVHVGQREGFLMAGSNGLRFVARQLKQVRPGDTVEVAGFPELGYASPVLRVAEVRVTGRAALPPAGRLSLTNLNQAQWDSTRVVVEGVLVEVRGTPEGGILDMQSEGRNFCARLEGGQLNLNSLPAGSRLELTGVYAALNAKTGEDAAGAAFELLLNSPTDIRVVARPPWWTPQRLAMVVGTLALGLVAALVWVTQLHRKVEQRTLQLEEQISKRQVIEQHRAAEQERARIAKDLHDELGSGLTEVGLLASIPNTPEKAQKQVEQIGDRAREMVIALDEIVWAMNPKHDTVPSVGRYCCLYADRFLKLANITLRVKEPLDLPELSFNAIHRHELFLAFKEALANVVRHSGANEVWLGLHVVDGKLRLALTDNGCGMKQPPHGEGADGLTNMRLRVEKTGGRFSITSLQGRGTALRFYIPIT